MRAAVPGLTHRSGNPGVAAARDMALGALGEAVAAIAFLDSDRYVVRSSRARARQSRQRKLAAHLDAEDRTDPHPPRPKGMHGRDEQLYVFMQRTGFAEVR